MEKFANFTKITSQYLHGKLGELVLDYEDSNHLRLLVSYKINDYYWLDYEMDLDIDRKDVDFGSHRSKGNLNKVELSREADFEKAVLTYMFE